MRFFSRVITLLITGCLIAAASVAIPFFLGFRVYAVISSSMAPAILPGAAVYVHPEEFADICEGDIITYSVNGVSVTHRVVEKQSAKRAFTVKGDANDTLDSRPVPYEDIIGKVKFCVPYAGYAAELFADPGKKLLFCGTVIWMYAVRTILGDMMKTKQEEAWERENI
ncbi:MAG: signal peptidase I [Eubacteriales bacterium]|nr:signal peptidase I [Eubacteriales bacterium]